MGSVHQLPLAADAKTRLLEKLVSDMISQHPDPDVARRWSEMARQTVSRYPGPPMPTQPVLDLGTVEGLSVDQTSEIQAITENWLLGYFEDVRKQMMAMHRDLLKLQKTVAEIESDR